MPTLMQKSDGSYFIRHYYNQHNTWQVLGKGVHFLRQRGVMVGDRFSTTLFMKLWSRRLIHHGDVAPAEHTEAAQPAPELCEQVRRLHKALRAGDVAQAERLTMSDSVRSTLAELFSPREAAVTRWSQDVLSVSWIDPSSQVSLGATALGVVYVVLRGPQSDLHGIKEYWLLRTSDSKWRCASVEADVGASI